MVKWKGHERNLFKSMCWGCAQEEVRKIMNNLVQNWDHWQALVNMLMGLQVS
jgi:hypothetical protein